MELQTYLMKKNDCQNHSMETLPTQKRVSSRLFVFEREDTHRSQLTNVEIDSNRQFHDISQLFQRFCPLEEHDISIYNPETNKFQQLSSFGLSCVGVLPNFLLEPRIILIRYTKLRKQHKCKQEDAFLIIKSKSEQKSKERSIKQVIDLVQMWRKTYQQMQTVGNNCKSLRKIAQQLGVSKKTLDDYYYHLRVGEFYQFQFRKHLHQKIGVLRSFVKKVKPKREAKDKYFRHPKSLKIIDVKIKKFRSLEIDDYLKHSIQFPVSIEFGVSDLNASGRRQFKEEISKKIQFFLKYSAESNEDNYSNNFQQYSEDFDNPIIKLTEIVRENKEEDLNDYFLRGFKQPSDNDI